MSTWRPVLLTACLTLALAAHSPARPVAHAQTAQIAREITIVVDHGAYHPSRIELQAGERVRLKFLRKEQSSCTHEVLFPKLNIKRELPPGKPVFIDLPPLAPGSYEFHCGMKMIKGLLVVTAGGRART
jgi:plastocyanin domain-containing protein